eukprot:CAMPEP_0116916870 /NCGR_PEP_ID=MMETSP0467-20121206/18795_1 /TAXON_ID=283647 /ORGANISM="Mesodinium pulex, Strain SPMC105" /LENGTH=145 /DNA_ID=CAMNT_0004593835 /DNA_START=245 /DNA_END=683 /DNA_ORIENTATION=-
MKANTTPAVNINTMKESSLPSLDKNATKIAKNLNNDLSFNPELSQNTSQNLGNTEKEKEKDNLIILPNTIDADADAIIPIPIILIEQLDDQNVLHQYKEQTPKNPLQVYDKPSKALAQGQSQGFDMNKAIQLNKVATNKNSLKKQ